MRRRKAPEVTVPLAVGYVRVSTEDQAREGVSLDAQRAKIQAWCELNGRTLLAIHADEGISGKSTSNRPGLQSALEQACGERAALVAISISRLSRSVRDLLDLAERLEHAGADMVSLSENIDTSSAAGRLVFKVFGVLAEFEREQIGERTSTAMRHMSANGQHVGCPPRGTRIVEGRLEVADEAQFALYRRAKDLRNSGLTVAQVCDALTAEGFVPLRGKRFWPSAVRYMLTNPNLARVAS